jgi:hypothetical protein
MAALIVKLQRWWVLNSKIFAEKSTSSKGEKNLKAGIRIIKGLCSTALLLQQRNQQI